MAEHSASLSAAVIAAHRSTPERIHIEVVAETGSTNADLMARGAAGTLEAPLLRIAEHQSAGRGRAGRSWLSSPGDSLTFSLAWRFASADGPQRLSGLPLAVGVALAEALAGQGVPVQLKWPNDLLRDGAKLAGILIETQTGAGATVAVIGVGMNLRMPDALEQQIGRQVAAAPWLARMDRNALVALLLDALAAALAQFERHGFAPFAARWNVLHAWAGQKVAIIDHGVTLQQGRAAGVDDSGRLLLDTDTGRVAIAAGDVSLRLDAI
jgi:BirA family biotin operon repressor/biotin-[acetyl-CoA-carboxylase] ligase